jgi:multisubunit Na+/H+ antiporter MnhE subunit
MISYQGYVLGFILSLVIIYYNVSVKHNNLTTMPLVCIVLATSFVANYFYYIIHPKSDWMLHHLQNKEEIKAWLEMYREMQYNYHMGIALGIVGVGLFAYAFRC